MALTKFAYLRLPAMIVLILSIVLSASNFVRPSRAVATYNVSISGFAFNPTTIPIFNLGDTVNWTNNDGVIYTLWFVNVANQSTYLMSPPIAPGESWAYTFTEILALDYHSFERLWITGFIRYPGDADGSNFVDVSDFAILGAAWFKGPGEPGYDPRTDFDGSNFIDVSDFAILGAYWFRGPT